MLKKMVSICLVVAMLTACTSKNDKDQAIVVTPNTTTSSGLTGLENSNAASNTEASSLAVTDSTQAQTLKEFTGTSTSSEEVSPMSTTTSGGLSLVSYMGSTPVTGTLTYTDDFYKATGASKADENFCLMTLYVYPVNLGTATEGVLLRFDSIYFASVNSVLVVSIYQNNTLLNQGVLYDPHAGLTYAINSTMYAQTNSDKDINIEITANTTDITVPISIIDDGTSYSVTNNADAEYLYSGCYETNVISSTGDSDFVIVVAQSSNGSPSTGAVSAGENIVYTKSAQDSGFLILAAPTTTPSDLSEETIEMLEAIRSNIIATQGIYIDKTTGFVPDEKKQALLEEILIYMEELVNNGFVTNYENEGGSILFMTSVGVQMRFTPYTSDSGEASMDEAVKYIEEDK